VAVPVERERKARQAQDSKRACALEALVGNGLNGQAASGRIKRSAAASGNARWRASPPRQRVKRGRSCMYWSLVALDYWLKCRGALSPGPTLRVLDDLSTGSLANLAAIREHVEFIEATC